MEGIADNSGACLALAGADLARIAAAGAKTDAGSFRSRIDSFGSCGLASAGAGHTQANSEKEGEEVPPPPKNHQIALRH